MKAIFIGADGSLGLKHGRTYDIKAISIAGLSKHPITIRIDGIGVCPYSSFESLSANWNLLTK